MAQNYFVCLLIVVVVTSTASERIDIENEFQTPFFAIKRSIEEKDESGSFLQQYIENVLHTGNIDLKTVNARLKRLNLPPMNLEFLDYFLKSYHTTTQEMYDMAVIHRTNISALVDSFNAVFNSTLFNFVNDSVTFHLHEVNCFVKDFSDCYAERVIAQNAFFGVIVRSVISTVNNTQYAMFKESIENIVVPAKDITGFIPDETITDASTFKHSESVSNFILLDSLLEVLFNAFRASMVSGVTKLQDFCDNSINIVVKKINLLASIPSENYKQLTTSRNTLVDSVVNGLSYINEIVDNILNTIIYYLSP